MDESSLKLISSLEENCFKNGVDNSEYKFYYLLFMMEQLNIINIGNKSISTIFDPLKVCFPRYSSEYQELIKLGHGSFGDVFLSRYFLDNNCYAIKKIILKGKHLYNIKNIISEIDIISKLDHPNIVRYYFSWVEPIINTYNHDKKKKKNSNSLNDLTLLPVGKLINRSNTFPNLDQNLIENKINFSNYYDSSESNSCSTDNNEFTNSETKFVDDIEINNYSLNYSSNNRLIDNCIIDNKNTKQIYHYNDNKQIAECNSLELIKKKYINKNELHLIFYIQMQFCKDGNLESYLNKRIEVDYFKSYQILTQLIEGIKYLHHNSIIHRDLKPNNIFILNNKIKIGDFGLSVTEDNIFTINDDNGCFLYKDKFSKNMTKINDIYSLGVICFQLFYNFNTTMERFKTLSNINMEILLKYFPNNQNIINFINFCTSANLSERLNINQLSELINISNI